MSVTAFGPASRLSGADEEDLSFLNEPLLPGEDGTKYQQLLNRISEAIKPKDVLEEFWVSDVANQVWETVRYRRIAVNLLNAVKQKALERVLHDLVHWEDSFGVDALGSPFHVKSEYLAWKYVLKDNEDGSLDEVDRVLRKAGLDASAVVAEAAALRTNELKCVNQMLAKSEARRAATLRAMERHRTGLGVQLQALAQEFQQATLDAACDQPVPTKLAA